MITTDNIKQRYGCEMALLILCCRVFFNTATIAELKLFVDANSIDWDIFINLATLHRVRPVGYRIIMQLAIPEQIKRIILLQLSQILKKNWRHAIETERIIVLLKNNNIDALPYKGAAFSKQFFGDLALRESSDIDLIIKPEDLEATAKILKDDHYLPELEDVYKYLDDQYLLYYKDYNLNKFENDVRLFHLELHWAITEPYIGLSPEVNSFLYQKACTESIFVKANVTYLDDISHFSAVLIHHSVKDIFKSLKNIVDIAQVLRQPFVQNELENLSARFAHLRLKGVFALSDMLVAELTGVKKPLQSSVLIAGNKLTNHFMDELCLGKGMKVNEQKHILTQIKKRALLHDSAPLKWRFFLTSFKYRFIPGEKDFQIFRLPKPVFFIYYLLKPFRSLLTPYNADKEKRKLNNISREKSDLLSKNTVCL